MEPQQQFSFPRYSAKSKHDAGPQGFAILPISQNFCVLLHIQTSVESAGTGSFSTVDAWERRKVQILHLQPMLWLSTLLFLHLKGQISVDDVLVSHTL